jgi:hypothetical protein
MKNNYNPDRHNVSGNVFYKNTLPNMQPNASNVVESGLFGGNNVRVMATPSADFESTLPTEGWVNF